ncbi:methyltransferase domain-containing protein [Streptomyces nigrescens]
MTTTATPSAGELRLAMADKLVADGAVQSPEWRRAFAEVPRELFVPEFSVRTREGLRTYREGDPDWLTTVYRDVSLLTQFDASGTATSSSTQPSLMARMLEALDVSPGKTVCEVGAGTFYQLALLCLICGTENVTAIDVDGDLVEAGIPRLQRAGYSPTVLVGDGMQGCPDRAPFDALLAACGVGRTPRAWREQVRPGGRIVANLGCGIVHLTVEDDLSARGSFLPELATFMNARATVEAVSTRAGWYTSTLVHAEGKTRTVPLTVDPASDGPRFLGSLVQPDAVELSLDLDGRHTHGIIDPADGSWARLTPAGSGTAHLDHGGPRDLWAEREPLLSHWSQGGQPSPDAYGLTVHPDGRHELTTGDTRWNLPE